MSMHELRLFRLAHEDLAIGAHFHAGSGWSLNVRARRQDETWGEAESECYEQLTTPELIDAIEASLFSIFG